MLVEAQRHFEGVGACACFEGSNRSKEHGASEPPLRRVGAGWHKDGLQISGWRAWTSSVSKTVGLGPRTKKTSPSMVAGKLGLPQNVLQARPSRCFVAQ